MRYMLLVYVAEITTSCAVGDLFRGLRGAQCTVGWSSLGSRGPGGLEPGGPGSVRSC